MFLVLLLKFYKIFLEDLTCLCDGKALAPRSGMHVEAYVKVEYFLLIYLFYFDNILNEIASMTYGCTLGLAKVNVLAHADDVVLLAPSMTALVDKFVDLAVLYELKINVLKTCFIILNDKFNRVYNSAILIEDQRVTRVNSFKYLGCFLTENMCDADDIERSMCYFNKSFGILIRKFYSLDIEPFYSLFLSYCTSFYGSELWVGRKMSLNAFKRLSVSYHTALKRILGWPKFVSNHLVCNILIQ